MLFIFTIIIRFDKFTSNHVLNWPIPSLLSLLIALLETENRPRSCKNTAIKECERIVNDKSSYPKSCDRPGSSMRAELAKQGALLDSVQRIEASLSAKSAADAERLEEDLKRWQEKQKGIRLSDKK